jgi:LEA14-like dessication related protein
MKKVLPILFFISILCSSCKIQPVVPTGVQDVKFGNIDPLKGIVALDLGLKINNPNGFAVTVYGLDLEITVANVYMGKVTIADKFKIEKNKEDVYRVKVNATLTDLINGIPKILSAIKKKEADVSVTGFVRIGSGIFKHTFPVNVKQTKVSTSSSK